MSGYDIIHCAAVDTRTLEEKWETLDTLPSLAKAKSRARRLLRENGTYVGGGANYHEDEYRIRHNATGKLIPVSID